jgi:hypothetical protein
VEEMCHNLFKKWQGLSEITYGKQLENEIEELDTTKANKYLSVEESHNIEHKKENDRLKKEYIRRLRLILSTELSEKKKENL